MPGYGQTPPGQGTLPWGPGQVAQPAAQPGPGNSRPPWYSAGPLQSYDATSRVLAGQGPVYTRVHAAPLWSASNTTGAALAVTVAPTGIGDLMVVSVLNQGGTSVASLSGGGVPSTGPGAWQRVGTPWTDPEATPSILEFWWGVVNATGSVSLSVTFAAAVGAHFNEVTAQDFRCNMPGTWTAENPGGTITNKTNASSGTVTYPAITTTQPPEIYCGYASTPSGLSTSAPMAGFTAGLTNGNDCFILSPAYNGGGVQPTHGVSLSEATWAVGACFYMALPAAVTNPKMETLQDTFPGSTVDVSKWTSFNTPTVASNTLSVADTANSTLYTGITSLARYDLTGSYFLAHLTNGGGQFASTQAMIQCILDGSNSLSLILNNGSLQAQTDVAGSFVTRGSITWVSATMSWLRIRESGGTIFWDYSADSITWTNLTSLADPFAITGLQANIQEGAFATTDPAATSTWQNVNLPQVTQADAAGAAEALSVAVTLPVADAAGAADAISLPSTTPYLVGQLSTNATGTAFTVPVTTGTGVGDGIVVGSSEPGAGVISGVTDSRGNTWSLAKQVVSNPAVSGWTTPVDVAPLQPGDSIFITFSVNDSVFKEFIAAGVPGMSVPDTAAENTGSATSAAPSLPTLTLAAAGEYALAFLSSANAGGAVTWTTGTGLLTLHGGAGSYLSCAWVLAPSTAAVTPAGTLTSAAWRGVVIPFGAGGAPTPVTLADAGGAAEALASPAAVPLAESAGGTDQVAIAVTLGTADAAAAADVASVSTAVPLAEVGAGTEASAASATVPLADQAGAVEFSPRELTEAAGAADQVAATAAVPLAEKSAGVESVAVATTLATADNAAATDQLLPSVAVPLADAGGSADASAVSATLALADAAGGADAMLSGQPTALADTAGAADALAIPAETITLADAGAATEAIPIAETSGLPEAAGAAEALTVNVAVPLAEAGAGAEALTATVTLALADQAAAVEYSPRELTEAAGAAEALLPAVTTPAGDTAGAADVLSWTGIVSVADTGAGTETLAAAATVALADAGAAAEAPAVAASTPVAETAGASDAFTVTGAGTPTLADGGGAAEALAVNVTLAIPDVAAGDGSLATFQGAAISLADAGGAADTISVAAAAAVSFGEAGAATESAAAVVAAPAADTAAAAEGVTASATLPLTGQTGAAADALGASVSAPAAETGAGAELLAVAAQALAGDRAGAAESLGVSKPVVPLAEAAGAAESLSVAIALSFHQMPGWAVEPADPVWMAYPDTPEWAVEPVSERWTVHSQAGEWAADAAPTRWRIVMGTFEPIAAVSLEDINARWTSDQDGMVIDPVAGAFPVQFAFPESSGDENAPAEPVTWYPGVWVTPNGSAKGFLAQCLAGPGGGVVALVRGHRYDVWSEVDTGTARVRKFVGVQAVY